eukprot:TRINITY_DN27038_c0_g1_i1.p1 TRINITY_DN27038_c0_g1~~TRINITY_DN27038_c0_g1_i1.p1  ORF type:complete len:139 (+),score=31.89 TRINITY_DN27038_c0_g1_i1:3-419(+)
MSGLELSAGGAVDAHLYTKQPTPTQREAFGIPANLSDPPPPLGQDVLEPDDIVSDAVATKSSRKGRRLCERGRVAKASKKAKAAQRRKAPADRSVPQKISQDQVDACGKEIIDALYAVYPDIDAAISLKGELSSLCKQ